MSETNPQSFLPLKPQWLHIMLSSPAESSTATASCKTSSFGLALVCGVGFSLAPALQATKSHLTPALKEGSALQLPGYRRFGLRNLLMMAQVAASLMLLLMTGFL